jgi:NifB/MoaA-like Fe-S oxidoreductase
MKLEEICKDCGRGVEAYLYFVGPNGGFAPLGIGATEMVCDHCYYCVHPAFAECMCSNPPKESTNA